MESTGITELNEFAATPAVTPPGHHGLGRVLKAIVLTFALTCCAPSQAQAPTDQAKPALETTSQSAPILASYEGQNVSSIEVAGQPDVNTDQLSALLVQRAGEPYSQQKIASTIAALKASGTFTEVLPRIEPVANGLRVMLVLQPAYYFGLFEFPGASQFPYSRLVQITNYPSNFPYNASDVEQARANLLTFFHQVGFFQAEVTPEVKPDSSHGIVNVFFHTKLNHRGKFGEIHIVGINPEETQKFKHELVSVMARLKGSAIRPGKTYNLKTLTNATQYLQNRLLKQNRLAAQVKLAGAAYNASTNRADINFDIQAGPVIHVRLEGAHLWSWTRKSLLPVYQGIGVDPEIVQEGQQSLLSYYQGKGYFDAKVDASFNKQSMQDTITYRISKAHKHKVKEISVSGNKHISGDQLLSHVTVEKASLLFGPGKYSERLVRASANNLTAVYEAEGYSTVKVIPAVTREGGDIRVAFHIDEGTQDTVQALEVEGAETVGKDQLAPDGLKLQPGHPYSQKLVQADRTAILAHYLNAGYLTATFRETAKAVSKSDLHHVDVVYHIYEGPQVHTDEVVTLGRERTKQRLISDDLSSIVPGKPLTETQLLTSESLLYDHPGVFDWAEVDLRRPITTQNREDVLVKVHETKKNQITYGIGVEVINRGGSVPSGTVALPNLPPVGLPSTFKTSQKTFYGPRGTFEYTRSNVRGKGESISLTAFAGRLDQRGSAYYIDPRLRWTNWSSTLTVTGEHNSQNPIFSSDQVLGSYQIQRFLDTIKARTLFLRYSYSDTRLSAIVIPALVLPQDRNVRLSTLSGTFTRDTRDNTLDAHRGMNQSIQLDFNSSKLGSSVDFAKLQLQEAYYRQIPGKIIWANSVRIGLAQPFNRSRVPLSEEFFTGGGSTLRGFPLEGAGPQRKVPVCNSGQTDCSFIQVPSGGHELLLINSELRIPLPIKQGLGVVAFYDGGNVFPVVGLSHFTSLYSNSIGAGLRYATPVGPVRVDFGRNLNPTPGIQPNQYFISIGQAF